MLGKAALVTTRREGRNVHYSIVEGPALEVIGISGIVGGLLAPRRGDIGWRLSFLLGLLLAPTALTLWAPGLIRAPRIDAGTLTLIAAGLLVGFGTRYGSGCTSGHGVCGLSRLSPRSLVATLAFMAAGFATVFVIRHVI